jgi:hypothetical protein
MKWEETADSLTDAVEDLTGSTLLECFCFFAMFVIHIRRALHGRFAVRIMNCTSESQSQTFRRNIATQQHSLCF